MRTVPYHTTAQEPIRIEERLPPGPCIVGMVLVSIAIWTIFIWLAVHLL